MSASNFSSCPASNSLPDFVNIPDIPRNISTIFVPARQESYDPMVSCCAPKPVQLAGGCYYWCEVPTKSSGDIGPPTSCLSRSKDGNTTAGAGGVSISGYHAAEANGANDVATGWAKVVLSAVAVTAALHVVSM